MQMKIVLPVAFAFAIGSASVALAGPAPSAFDWDGYFSGDLGNTWFSGGGDSANGLTGDFRGTFERSFGNWGIQADGSYGYQSLGFEQSGLSASTLGATLHGFYRAPGQWLAGGFVQYNVLRESLHGNSIGYSQYSAGGEAQYFGANYSVYGQLGYQYLNDGGADGVAANLRGRYFFTPNWYGQANVGYSRLAANGASVDVVALGLASEYRFSRSPVTAFVSYSHDIFTYKEMGTDHINIDRVVVGLKWDLDGRSLWDHETGGASLDPLATTSESFLF